MLSEEQQRLRAGKLTASRVACLMVSDPVAIMRLYREMIGEELPEDLSRVWPVQLGSATEELNLRWYEMQTGRLLTRRGEVVIHPHHEWAACTLDGYDEELDCIVECKHVGGREPLEVVIDRYQPQMQWQMQCDGADQCALSVIMGASPPIVEYIPYDPEYAAELDRRAEQFMECVKARRLPVALDPVPAPVDVSRVYDMTGNNNWANAAVDWLATKSFSDKCRDAEKILKNIVPADAKLCTGHGVKISRDRAGRLSLREAQ